VITDPSLRVAQIAMGDEPLPILEETPIAPGSYLVPPVVNREEGAVRMLTIVLRSTGDKTRDVLRLRRIHGIVTSYPGGDRFAFHVFEFGRGYLIEFPNNTVGVCPELLNRLAALIGGDNVRLEPITFQ
jgi:DNA polymerase-3 subunit alpha